LLFDRTGRTAEIARQDADLPIRRAFALRPIEPLPGHHPAWRAGLRGRKRLHLGLRIEPRQNRLDRWRRRVLPDPIQPDRPAFSQNAPLRPASGLRMEVFLCRVPRTTVSVSRSFRTPIAGSASAVGFSSSRLLISVTCSRFCFGPSICKIAIGVRSTWTRLFDRAANNRIDRT
jgi:hypothetical protein